MKQNIHGFTLIEIIVVLVLISIISATVFSRSLFNDELNLAGEVAKIRNHIRHAQSMAMKRLDLQSDDRWGIKCQGGEYWLFNYDGFGTEDAPVGLPGQEAGKISLSDLGITMDAFTLFFDGPGVPYKTSSTNRVTTGSPLVIAISDGSETRNLSITPETGLIITQ